MGAAGWRYRLGDQVHDLTYRTLVMGILNRTPDSFFPGNRHADLDSAKRALDAAVEAGADIVDVGGVRAGDEVLDQGLVVHGPGKEEALAELAAEIAKRSHLLGKLDPFGDNVELEARSKGDDCRGQAGVLVLGGEERAVHLEDVHGVPTQVAQR